jgi:hypothetical protein
VPDGIGGGAVLVPVALVAVVVCVAVEVLAWAAVRFPCVLRARVTRVAVELDVVVVVALVVDVAVAEWEADDPHETRTSALSRAAITDGA